MTRPKKALDQNGNFVPLEAAMDSTPVEPITKEAPVESAPVKEVKPVQVRTKKKPQSEDL